MNFHVRQGVVALLDGLDVIVFDETEEDGAATFGPKHWHTFELVARQP